MENGFQSDCFNPSISSHYCWRTGIFFLWCSQRHQHPFRHIYAPTLSIKNTLAYIHTYTHAHTYAYMHICAPTHYLVYAHTCTCISAILCVCVHTCEIICAYTSDSNYIYLSSIYDYIHERLLVFHHLKQSSEYAMQAWVPSL